METPCCDAPVITNQQTQKYPHLQNVSIVEAPNETIDILLDVENSDILATEERMSSNDANDPIAARCPLGWYVQGGRISNESLANAVVNFSLVSAVGELEDFLGVDCSGLEPRRCKCRAEDQDKLATESMEKSVTRFENGKYQIGLPWVKSSENPPNNYAYAVKRLLNLEAQFKKKAREWEVYCRQMRDQVEQGVARLVPATEMEDDFLNEKKMWFLLHFGVMKDSKTTSVRVVYDGKARYQGHALNDYLAKGENLNTNLFEVALRYREYVLRESPKDPIKVYELTTVTFEDKPSPTAATIALRHVATENAPDDPEIRHVVEEHFYVDDLTESQRDVEEVGKIKHKLTTALNKGQFVIRDWLSNKKEICDKQSYPPDEATTVLGTKWNLSEDTLQVKKVNDADTIATKRNLLKKTASYYDVFGILSGVLVRPKIILQKLWKFDIGWDTPISPERDIYRMIEAVKLDLRELDTIKVNRCLIPQRYQGKSPLPRVSLHGFSNVSDDVMVMGIWLRWSEKEDDEAELTFVCARACLASLKQVSIPRKELQAILLLSRLMLQNTIDLVSRGVNATGMKEVIDGPSFMKKTPSSWPETQKNVNRDDTELKKFHVRNAKVLAVKLDKDEPVIDPTEFSSWPRACWWSLHV
ncbi:uncharacterized protein LOC135488570 [Lineus longissimus]|uniref:uncharacterized protein LOC135488570 n=1 Tax=Lineus longissimus TaxID=88925 RepID=UPI00315DAAA4